MASSSRSNNNEISSMQYDLPQKQQLQKHPSISFSSSSITSMNITNLISSSTTSSSSSSPPLSFNNQTQTDDHHNTTTSNINGTPNEILEQQYHQRSNDVHNAANRNNNSNETKSRIPRATTTAAETQITTRSILLPQNILFVHIGKSGGQSLKYALKVGCQTLAERVRKRHCLKNLPTSEISNKVQGYKHVTKLSGNNNIQSLSSSQGDVIIDGYLIVLRHPLDRFVSWYNYMNPNDCINKKRTPVQCKTESQIRNSQSTKIQLKRPIPNLGRDFFYGCFPTIHNISAFFNITTNTNTTHNNNDNQGARNHQQKRRRPKLSYAPSCLHLIKKVLQGDFDPNNLSEIFGHMVYNIQRYINIIPQLSELQKQQQKLQIGNMSSSSSSNGNTPQTITTRHQQQGQRRKFVVYIVRTEYLWEDMKHIDQILGGDGNFGHIDGLHVTHYNSTTTTTTTTATATATATAITTRNGNNETQQRRRQIQSSEGKFNNNNKHDVLPVLARQRICCLLQKEMMMYYNLLVLWSDNLTTEQSTQTWQNAIKYCGGVGGGGRGGENDDNVNSTPLQSWDDYFNKMCLNDTMLLLNL